MTQRSRDGQHNTEVERFFALSTDMFCIVGFDGYFKLVNPAWETTLGFSIEEILSRPLHEFIHPDDREDTPTKYAEQMADGHDSIEFENRCVCKDGSYRWLLWNAKIIPEQELIYAVGRDITDRKRMEEGLRNRNESLEERGHERTRSLEEANQHLRAEIAQRQRSDEQRRRLEQQLLHSQKMEAVGTLAGGIAHDFNNVLAAIVGYAELIQGEVGVNPQASSDLDELLKTANRGKQLVQRILAFSRPQEPERRPLDLKRAVDEILQVFRATIPANIQVASSIQDAPQVAADETSVQQVLVNLGTNAAHAMPRGGIMEIRLEPVYVRDRMVREYADLNEGEYVVLSVRDSGGGIEPKIKDRVFEPFFTTKAPGTGTGLGLAIVHGIMRDHGGAIILSSKPGQGTFVRCFFPALSEETADSAKIATTAPRGNGEHVLYVDDEPQLVQVGQRRLERLGYTVTTATDGRAALKVFSDRPADFDIVVADHLMPRMTGLDLARELIRIRPEIRIILLTGFIEDLPVADIQESGVPYCIKKPVTTDELARTVRKALSG